ncbi:two-component sensor histidine kinase [Pseudoxanthomonas kalamensis DSM 18571]|uniref:ATP-binding protein n=1 Tax=Pseudoxanthomonas kalamensis TaxID=289483 RepID=UPI001391B8CD|nr:ATP-binding protein [Pseudoxanthomonas kalamensis]KAF1712079.1 two-component sensor histidine kinase [Pseudoxanthomonas kalamensis DSM 18571]
MLLSLIVVMSLVMAVAAGFSYRAGLQEAGEMFDAKLAHSARVLVSLVDAPLGDLAEHPGDNDPVVIHGWHGQAQGVGDALAFPSGHAYETKLAFQVRDVQGRLLLRSDSGPDTPLAPREPGFRNVVLDGEQWRSFTLQAPSGRWYQSAERADIRREIAGDIALGTLLPLLLALPLLALSVWWVVRWATRGLAQVSEEIGARAPERMQPIRLQHVPEEIQGLVAATNGLLARLEASLARERRFTADAAHELRTPLAALKVHADNLRHAADEGERSESQRQVDASVRRMERLVAQLLSLAKLEPDAPRDFHDVVDMSILVQRQVEQQSALAAARDIELVSQIQSAPMTVHGEEVALETLVRNLLENALRYTPRGGRVEIALADDGDALKLRMEDSGPGIPPHARERVFERFHRELGTQTEGSGLGLPIVSQVLALHGGAITLDDSPALGGLRVRVRLPRQPAH